MNLVWEWKSHLKHIIVLEGSNTPEFCLWFVNDVRLVFTWKTSTLGISKVNCIDDVIFLSSGLLCLYKNPYLV